MKPLILLVALGLGFSCTAHNILVFLPYPLWSQYVQVEPLFRALALRGHNVTVASPFPPKNETLRFRYIPFLADRFWKENVLPVDQLLEAARNNRMFDVDIWKIQADYNMPQIFESPIFSELVRPGNNQFDLIFSEIFFAQEALVVLGHIFNAPVVAFASFGHIPQILRFIGALNAVTYLPFYELEYAGPMSLTQRMINAFVQFRTMIYNEYWYYPEHDDLLAKYLPGPLPRITDMLRNISLFLLTGNFAVDGAKLYPPNVVEISGLHFEDSPPLDEELDAIMKSAKNGVILVSFGSILNPSSLSKKEMDAFLSVFKDLDQTVLWKVDTLDSSYDIPTNVYTRKWLNQKSILAHPNCVLFLTHGGLSSLMEAIVYAVPIVGMPFFADQMKNVAHADHLGYGIHLPYRNLTPQSLRWAIKTVLRDPRFKENINTASKIFKDRPMSSLDTAIYWIEYVLRHKGAHHLKPLATHMPWYELFLLDIIAVYFTAFVVLFYLIVKMISLLFRKYVVGIKVIKEKIS